MAGDWGSRSLCWGVWRAQARGFGYDGLGTRLRCGWVQECLWQESGEIRDSGWRVQVYKGLRIGVGVVQKCYDTAARWGLVSNWGLVGQALFLNKVKYNVQHKRFQYCLYLWHGRGILFGSGPLTQSDGDHPSKKKKNTHPPKIPNPKIVGGGPGRSSSQSWARFTLVEFQG